MEAGSTKGVTARATGTAADIRSTRRALSITSKGVAEIYSRVVVSTRETVQIAAAPSSWSGVLELTVDLGGVNANAAMGDGDGGKKEERGEGETHLGNLQFTIFRKVRQTFHELLWKKGRLVS